MLVCNLVWYVVVVVVWYSVVCGVVWVRKKVRCDGLLLCSERTNERCIHVMLYPLSFSDLIRGDE